MIGRLWRALGRLRRSPGSRPSAETSRARRRLEDVRADDARIAELVGKFARTRRENHLGPKISEALRARRT